MESCLYIIIHKYKNGKKKRTELSKMNTAGRLWVVFGAGEKVLTTVDDWRGSLPAGLHLGKDFTLTSAQWLLYNTLLFIWT